MNDVNRICVLGLGYIGLPTASLLATKGYEVRGVDISTEVVNTINLGDAHFSEPELDILVRSAIQSGKLIASTTPSAADVFIIAVPTPFRDGYKADLSYIKSAVKAISSYLQDNNLVILESTSPVGTTEYVSRIISQLRPDLEGRIDVVYCPERVLPGRILKELIENDRIVGGVTAHASDRAASFYRSFLQGEIMQTNARTAEMVKLSENAFRDVNIAYANELSLLCDKYNIDVWEMIELSNHHPRVNILSPGPGVGGHCIAVDPWFLISSLTDQAKLMRTAREVNSGMPEYIVSKVEEAAHPLDNPTIACLGLSFKANVDDLRESPALEIVRELVRRKLGRIKISDPHIGQSTEFDLVTPEVAIAEADIVLLLVDHQLFRNIDRALLSDKLIIDTRGLFRQ